MNQLLTPEQIARNNLRDPNAITLNEKNKFVFISTDDNQNKLMAYLSSNYQEIFLIIDGADPLQLPNYVDEKQETKKIGLFITRNYKIVIDNNVLEFDERMFYVEGRKDRVPCVLLLNEFGSHFTDIISNSFCYFREDESKEDFIKITPLKIYFGFSQNAFLRAWRKVGLRDDNQDPCKFDHAFSHLKYNYPIFIVNRRATESPTLEDLVRENRTIKRPKPRDGEVELSPIQQKLFAEKLDYPSNAPLPKKVTMKIKK